jgi:hypothetical protein
MSGTIGLLGELRSYTQLILGCANVVPLAADRGIAIATVVPGGCPPDAP